MGDRLNAHLLFPNSNPGLNIQKFREIIRPTKKVESLAEAATKNAALVFKPPTTSRKTRRQVFNIYVLEARGENASSGYVLGASSSGTVYDNDPIIIPKHTELKFFFNCTEFSYNLYT